MSLRTLAIVCLLATTFSMAQETPEFDIAAAYSDLQVLKGYTISMNGGSGSGPSISTNGSASPPILAPITAILLRA